MDHFDFSFVYEHHQTFEPGQTIFEKGDPGDAMYILLDGEIKIKIGDHTIDELYMGDVFGEMALVDAKPRSASAVAHTECKLMRIDEERFGELAHQIPQFGLSVMRIMSQRTRRLMQDEISRQRMAQELAIGKEIQEGLLPKSMPEFEGWEFSAAYQTATQVGGDLYDFILNSDRPDCLDLVVADATGKGVPAALFMASLRSVMRTLAQQSNSPSTILQHANRAIIEDMDSPLFLSCLFGRLDLKTGELRLANAGHDWPIWVKAAENKLEPVQMSGFVLGMMPDIKPEETRLIMQPGDSVVFFTDGITEARNKAGEFYDDERLHQVIQAHSERSADEIAQKILESVENFTADHPRSDDLTLVVIKRKGESF